MNACGEFKKIRGEDYVATDLEHLLTEHPIFQELLNPQEASLFLQYANDLIETNKYLNLTALTKAEEMAFLHFFDSLTLLPILSELGYKDNQALLLTDVGSGAGFPGIPVKIMRPEWSVQLLDALGKRVRFLNACCADLGLSNIEAFHVRAEEAGKQKQFREQSDLVSARAVAPLNILVEYCLPLVKLGGYFIAMKAEVDEELLKAESLIQKLGGEILDLRRLQLPYQEAKRSLVLIKKTHKTPMDYPRNQAQIKQKR